MFILPLSLFVITTYLRPRTQAELSYLITAVECLSGLWCLLFAPFQIQVSLIGLFLLRNTGSLKSLLEKNQASNRSYLDLSDASSPAIDIEASPMESPRLNPVQAIASQPENLQTTSIIPQTIPLVPNLPTPSFPTQNTDLVSQHSSESMIDNGANTEDPTITIALQSHPLPSQAKPSTISHPQKALVKPCQVVQMQYRGTTYFKNIPTP